MKWPELSTLWQAVETYLKVAYDGTPPSGVRSKLEALHAADPAAFYDSAVFETSPDQAAVKRVLRLGNRYYPHMKLVIESRPDDCGCLFRVDSHDAHCCPPAGAREHTAFRELMERNRAILQVIESDWEQQGLPTFKTFLKEDLARRRDSSRPSS